MTVVAELKASYAFVERNINLTRRYWGWEIVWLFYTAANAMAVVLIARSVNAATGSDALNQAQINNLVLFLTIGALVWHYLVIIFEMVSEMIAWERWEGTIEYTFMAPIHRGTQMIGTTLFSLVYGLVHTAVILVLIVLVFDLDMAGADYFAAFAVLAVGSISFIGIGIMGAVLPLLYPERGAQMAAVVQAALVLVSGVYAVPAEMPETLRSLSVISPARYVLEGMRDALMEGRSVADMGLLLSGLLLSGLVLVPMGVWVFGRGERYAKRRGKLKRSG